MININNIREKYLTDSFENDLLQLDVRLTNKQIAQFLRYYEMLIEWNGL